MTTFLLAQSCTSNLSILRTIYIAKTILQILCTIAPIILMAVTIKDLLKSIISSEIKLGPQDFKKFVSRAIAVILVFLMPTIVKSIFGSVDSFDMKTFSMCWNITKEDFDNLVKLESSNCNNKTGYVWDKYSNTCTKEIKKENQTIVVKAEDMKKGNKSNQKVTHLNYIAQGDYPNVPFCSSTHSVANSGCGGAAFAMIASSYSNPKYDMKYVANWFCENMPSLTDGGLRNEAVVDQKTLSAFGLEGEIVFGNGTYSGKSYNAASGNAMLKAVQEGKSVMFGMPRHWAVAGPNEKCSNDQVYLYDPGMTSRNGCYTPKQLFDLTYNSKNHCNTEGICGWDIGIALS